MTPQTRRLRQLLLDHPFPGTAVLSGESGRVVHDPQRTSLLMEYLKEQGESVTGRMDRVRVTTGDERSGNLARLFFFDWDTETWSIDGPYEREKALAKRPWCLEGVLSMEWSATATWHRSIPMTPDFIGCPAFDQWRATMDKAMLNGAIPGSTTLLAAPVSRL